MVARVNGEPITLQELSSKLDELSLERESPVVVNLALEDLIKEKLLLEQAQRMGITLSDSALDLMVEEIKKEKNPEDFSDQELRRKLKTLWLIGKVSNRLCPPPLIRDREALAYYRTHKSQFHTPKMVIARQIVVATREEAEKIQKILKKSKADFAQLAKEYSLGPEGKNGGLLDPIYHGEEPPGFKVLFSMKRGEISPIVKSPYGYHIFKVEKVEKGRVIPFQKAKAQIKERIQRARQKECLDKWLAEARKKARVEIYRDKLKLLEEKP